MSTWKTLDIARPMRALRDAAGLTQSAAQERLGVHPSTLTTPEQRGPTVRLDTLLARAAAFGLEIEIRVRAKR